MEVKLVEIRDKATFIPAMAVKLSHEGARDPHAEVERWLLRRAGYSKQQIDPLSQGPLGLEPYIILCKLDGVEAQYDPFSWGRSRTMGVAHRWLIEHWTEVASGDVVDVEFILDETKTPKRSERLGETNIVRTLGEEVRIIP